MPEVMLSSAQVSDSFSTSSSSSSPDPSDPSPLRKSLKTASDQGDLDQIQAILETWTTSTFLTPPTPIDLESALSYAVLRGHVSILSLLLDHGAPTTIPITPINSCDHYKSTLLAIFDLFVQHGWSAADNTNALRAMRSIITHHDAESLLSWFLTHSAPPDGLPSDLENCPLRWAIKCASSPAVPSLLLSYGASIKHTSALHAAASRRDDEASVAMMSCLLDAGADVDELGYEGWVKLPRQAVRADWGTLLHKAAKAGSVIRARCLVERGANVGKKSRRGYTARDTAQFYRREEVVIYIEEVMKKKGMEIVAREIPRRTTDLGPTWRALD